MDEVNSKAKSIDGINSEEHEMNREEFIISHSGPAILSNRFYIARGPWGVRLAFAEQIREDIPSEFRAAIVMSNQDAIALYKCLHNLLNNSSGNMKLTSVKVSPDSNNLNENDEPNN